MNTEVCVYRPPEFTAKLGRGNVNEKVLRFKMQPLAVDVYSSNLNTSL